MTTTCPICDGGALPTAFSYGEPPPGETAFELPPGQAYAREYRRCATCGHFVAVTEIDLDAALYSGGYVDATYSDLSGLRVTYDRIMSLPPEASDNVQRVRRIAERTRPGSLLDVGSGLGVFPARMKETGWDVTALDPDPRAVEHTRTVVGVETVCADFMQADELGSFDLVSLNKVLEHVADPAAMLRRAGRFMAPSGAVYLELPDGEAAALDPDGGNREEFFIEHLHVFSMASLCRLSVRAGFTVELCERLREPSGKYTLVAWLRRSARSA
jgi:SAM-dependent methyltransferase